MPIPTYQELLRPVLELATKQDISRRSATAAMIKQFSLNEEEQKRQIPSGGSTYINNRTGWAMTFLTKAKLIHKVAKATYRATNQAADFLRAHPESIAKNDLEQIDGFLEAWGSGKKTSRSEQPQRSISENLQLELDTTPEEQIGSAVSEIENSLRSELLEQLHAVDPFRFEQIVIDLLFAMGYGGSRDEARRVTKKSNDEGIDGIINEDRLGLDVVYVQAKRWQGSVGRKEIQSFVGALAGQQANKGIFITTSTFTSTATDYAAAVSQKVILIDGERLADLMIEHDIGVSTVRAIALKRIDSDYFEES